MKTAAGLWVYLSTTPLLWLTLTLAAYAIADAINKALGRHPLANQVIIAVALVITALEISKTPFETYFAGAQFVHFLLGPATVALAVPLVENWERVKRSVVPILIALVAGSLTAIVTAVGTAALLGAPRPILASIAEKSVTTPIAMGIAEKIGGIPSLTAVLVILTGILGAIIVTPLDGPAQGPRPCRTRFRRRRRFPRHRHRPRLPGQRPGRDLLRACHGAERHPHRNPGAAAGGAVRRIA